jgi:glycosyltransferase involved in cell wall biosynthesis
MTFEPSRWDPRPGSESGDRVIGGQATTHPPSLPKLSVIIPVYNEAGTIECVVTRVLTTRLPGRVAKEVLIVDDGSTDGTAAIIRRLQAVAPIKAFRLGSRQGKSAAVRLGLAHATGDIVVVQDADLEYDSAHLAHLLGPILAGHASIVFGSRFQGRIRRMAPLIWLANRWSTFTVNLLFGTRLSDVNTGYKMVKRELLAHMTMTADDFGCDAEMTAKWLRKGYPILEIPIDYTGRTRQEGKKMNWMAAIRMYLCFIRYRFARDDQPT